MCLVELDRKFIGLAKIYWPRQDVVYFVINNLTKGYKTCLGTGSPDHQGSVYMPSELFWKRFGRRGMVLNRPVSFPPAKKGRPRTTDLREVFNAIKFVLDTGCQWRSIPPCFPPSATVQYYFYSLRRFEHPAAAAVDSQSVRATKSGGPSGCDAGKKAEGRKRHTATDVEGLLIEITVQPASTQDRNGDLAVILGMLEKAPHVGKIWADGGCQGPMLASELEKLGLGSALEIVKNPRMSKQLSLAVIKIRYRTDFVRCLESMDACGQFLSALSAGPRVSAWIDHEPFHSFRALRTANMPTLRRSDKRCLRGTGPTWPRRRAASAPVRSANRTGG